MPALPPVPGALRCEFTFATAERSFSSSVHFFYDAEYSPTLADVTSVAEIVSAQWNDNMRPYYATDITLTAVTVTDLSTDSAPRYINSISYAGTDDGARLPTSVATCIDFQISRRYRGGKPKIFLPLGTSTDLATSEQWGSDFITGVTDAWGSVMTNSIDAMPSDLGAYDYGSISYYEGFLSVQDPITLRWRNLPKPRATPILDPATTHTTRARVSSQRRRTRM